MDKERKKAICRLIRATHLRVESMESFFRAFTANAIVMGSPQKSEKEKAVMANQLRSDEFLEGLEIDFPNLTIDDMNTISEFFDSWLMNKFRDNQNLYSLFYSAALTAYNQPLTISK